MQSFAFVGNTSVGSKNFLNWASQHTYGSQVLVQGNRIYDTQDDYAMVTGNAGPWLLVDNVIRNRVGYSGPSIRATANDKGGGDAMFVGNTYTGTSTISRRQQRTQLPGPEHRRKTRRSGYSAGA